MKAVFEQTPQRMWESFHCEVVRKSSYDAMWHFHPEYQITLVLKSSGYRLVGDNITALRSGDLVLVGANLPHVWHQKSSKRPAPDAVHAIVVRFLETFLGRDFLEVPEMAPVRRLLKRAQRGLHVTGKTREVVAAKMQRISSTTGLERIASLLSILSDLAQSSELCPIASPGFAPPLAHADQDRLARVVNFIHAHFHEPMARAAVAAEAHLSISAFSRFFKFRTGKTLPQYVNELRVGRACELLAEDRLKISDIGLACGFHNLANFNRHFHRIIQLTPREYRQRVERSAM